MTKAAESLSGAMSIMDTSGHKELKWDMNNSEEIAAAQETFERLMAQGYSGFGSKKKEEPKHVLKTFDPTMEDMVMVPRTVGG